MAPSKGWKALAKLLTFGFLVECFLAPFTLISLPILPAPAIVVLAEAPTPTPTPVTCPPGEWIEFTAGLEDDFGPLSDPPPSPRPEFVTAVGNPPQTGFDGTTSGQHLLHSFTDLPRNIVAAQLETHIQPLSSEPENDTIALYSGTPPVQLESKPIGTAVGGPPGLLPKPWSALNYPSPQVITWTLNADTIAAITDSGVLDVQIQDDTRVDYLKLGLCLGLPMPPEIPTLTPTSTPPPPPPPPPPPGCWPPKTLPPTPPLEPRARATPTPTPTPTTTPTPTATPPRVFASLHDVLQVVAIKAVEPFEIVEVIGVGKIPLGLAILRALTGGPGGPLADGRDAMTHYGSNQVAVAPRVYVANFDSDTVSVIDVSTHTVIATIPVGSRPFGVAVKPDGTRVYVTNYGGNTVSVIDASTHTVIATIPVGAKPAGVAANPDGTRVYVANEGSNSVSVIDTSTHTVVDTIPVESRPVGVAVNSDGTRVYVTNQGSNTVSVIDPNINRIIATIPVGTKPGGVAVKPDGARVYVANYGSNNVSVIDGSTHTVVATIPVGANPFGVAVNQGGTHVFVANSGDTNISVIEAATNTVIATIPLDGRPHSVAARPLP